MSIRKFSSVVYYSCSPWTYDVFLSFRGEDIRTNFLDHLYHALKNKAINVFKDDRELANGEAIASGLFKAIEESRFAIIIFSESFASSTWCLDEVLKIVESKNTSEQRIFPIFYKVDPSEVRKQTRNFREAFAKHEEAFRENVEKVQQWRDALKEVTNIKGWDFKDRHEVEFIQEIVQDISRRLRPARVRTFDNLVGINPRIQKLIKLVGGRRSNDVCMIGIWGMGGLGKTTVARAVYDVMSYEFEGSSFLANVRGTSEKDGLTALQKQLLSDTLMETDIKIHNELDGIQMIKSRLQHKRVLLVIDDVADLSQLNTLVGQHFWFGSGSRIIITTRDEHLLISHRVDVVYKAEALNHAEALQLFSSKAFTNNQPSEDYMDLIECVLEYASGLPLALNVLGSFLFGRTIDEWRSSLERLKGDSESEILNVLQISFDGLKEVEKKIFLDIACFFKGQDKEYVTKILDYCGFEAIIGISVLIEKSLITIGEKNKLWMHDLLEEMGRKIVTRQSPYEPGKHSRLWKKADVCHVLTKTTGTEIVEGIILEFPAEEVNLSARANAFSKMTNLRLLKIHNVKLPEGLEYLSKELRFLEWNGYPSKSLPSNCQLDKVVEVNMLCSCIERMWRGIKPLSKLRFMRLSHSRNLISTPDFIGAPNLEELILEGCTKLREIHPSLLVQKKLILLNLKDCTSLKTLPRKIAMESLKKLVLSGCSKLKYFPEIVENMECLLELLLDGTAIEELPSSIKCLTGLSKLSLENCKNLVRIPSTINGLTSLKALNLSGCKSKNVSESSVQVESVEELDVNGTAIRKPLSSIFLLKNLKALFFRGFGEQLSSTSWHLPFPINLIQRRNLDLMALRLPSLSGLHSLTKLNLSDCNLREESIPADIGSLFALEELDLSKNNFVSLPGTFNHLSKLKELKLEDCKRLQSPPELPSKIEKVNVNGCVSLETLSDAFKLCTSQLILYIDCRNCSKLSCRNSLPFSILKGFLEVKSITRSWFDIVVPGNNIPEWFSYQSERSSIKFVNPPYSDNRKGLLGYAVCCVFHIHKNPPRIRQLLGTHKLDFYVESYFSISPRMVGYTEFNAQPGRAVSDHLWLIYLPRELFAGRDLGPGSPIIFSFTANGVPGLEVKMCGVHPVYMRGVEEFNQITNQWSRSTVRNFDGFHQDFVGSSMDIDKTTSKRSLTDYVGAEASGSGCSDDEEPQPKRLRNLE